jgi:hypothetical protein
VYPLFDHDGGQIFSRNLTKIFFYIFEYSLAYSKFFYVGSSTFSTLCTYMNLVS